MLHKLYNEISKFSYQTKKKFLVKGSFADGLKAVKFIL